MNANDAINALSILRSKEAGAFSDEVSVFDAGVLGAATADVARATFQYINGEKTKEETKSEIDKAICSTIRTLVGEAISRGVDILADVIAQKVPVIAPIVYAVKDYVKKPVVEAAKIGVYWMYEKAKTGLNKAKELFFG